MKKDKEVISSSLISSIKTNDCVEEHIARELLKLKIQNDRYKSHIEKTASWIHIKDITCWKSFDFYHYFCHKYNEKYKKEFRLTGSIARAYNRIEEFVVTSKISNEEYKDFLDLSFSRYFNAYVQPILGNIVSPSLYQKLMNKKIEITSTDDLFDLDQVIARESEQFEEEIRDGEGVATSDDIEEARNLI